MTFEEKGVRWSEYPDGTREEASGARKVFLSQVYLLLEVATGLGNLTWGFHSSRNNFDFQMVPIVVMKELAFGRAK